MKRYTAVLLTSLFAVLWLALGLALGDKQTPEPGQQICTARWTKTPVSIDGVMSPGEYSAAIPFHVELNKPVTAPGLTPDYIFPPDNQDDLSYTFYAIYDAQNLYIAVDVADDLIIDDGPGEEPWHDDDAELFIDGDEVGNDYQLGQPGREGFQLLMDVGGDTMTMAGDDEIDWEAASGFRPRGYLVEFRVALSSIDTIDGDGEIPPGPGSSVGFNVTVGDDDNGGWPYEPPEDSYGAWDGRSPDWRHSREDDWGTLYFAPKVPRAPGSVEATATWGKLKVK